MIRKLVYFFVALGAAVVGYQLTAHAGAKGTYPITITTVAATTTVQGSLGSARNSSDTVQYMSCHVFAQTTDITVGYCTAKTAAGKSRSCTTADADIVAALQGMNGDSWVSWTIPSDGSNTLCGTMWVENDSDSPPK